MWPDKVHEEAKRSRLWPPHAARVLTASETFIDRDFARAGMVRTNPLQASPSLLRTLKKGPVTPWGKPVPR